VKEMLTGLPGFSVPEGSTLKEETVNTDTHRIRKTSRQMRIMKGTVRTCITGF
jgi:hypothetical protein